MGVLLQEVAFCLKVIPAIIDEAVLNCDLELR
jgi:hypothetical protein